MEFTMIRTHSTIYNTKTKTIPRQTINYNTKTKTNSNSCVRYFSHISMKQFSMSHRARKLNLQVTYSSLSLIIKHPSHSLAIFAS